MTDSAETAESSSPKKIQLFPQQIEHVKRLSNILQSNPFALDISALGSGKTFSSSFIALMPEFDFKHVVVVAPVSVQTKWRMMEKDYGVPVEYNMSFCGLRSVKLKQPKCGLLRRRDYTTTMVQHYTRQRIEIDKVEFFPTNKFNEIVEEGTLLVIDEIQNLKNISAQFAACQALIKAIVESPAQKSRVLLLSGSPIDKHEQAVTLFRTLNIMKQDALSQHNIGQRTIEWRGMTDITEYCRRIDAGLTRRITTRPGFHFDLRRGCYDLFQQIVKPAISSSMPTPALTSKVENWNAFYRIESPEDVRLMSLGISSLEKACSYNRETNTVNFAHTTAAGAMSAVTRALSQIETAKINTYARVAKEKLSSDPNIKVVICVNYTATVTDLKELLAEYTPLILTGGVSMIDRAKVLEKFQAPTTDRRLLIGNLGVCSTGIDLDDKDGRFPRFCLVNANYSSITLYQLSHRFQRLDTKSGATVHVVYGKQAHELSVLMALTRKGTVMKETTPDQVEAGVVFPGDYPRFDEHYEEDMTVISN
jgi:hypothetical protein